MAQLSAQQGSTPSYEVIQMISAKSIAARIEALAREIEVVFAGTDKLVVVGLLRGSFVFIADLVREIDLPVEVDFLEATSYGNAMQSSREVRILKDLRGEIAGRDVLVVEDIVDSGLTLNYLRRNLSARQPASLAVCALFVRAGRQSADTDLRYIGFEIPPDFVVGYGLDVAEKYRNIPHVARYPVD